MLTSLESKKRCVCEILPGSCSLGTRRPHRIAKMKWKGRKKRRRRSSRQNIMHARVRQMKDRCNKNKRELVRENEKEKINNRIGSREGYSANMSCMFDCFAVASVSFSPSLSLFLSISIPINLTRFSILSPCLCKRVINAEATRRIFEDKWVGRIIMQSLIKRELYGVPNLNVET